VLLHMRVNERMKINTELSITVDEDGRLLVPHEIAARYGLTPGSRVHIDDRQAGLFLYPSLAKLSKVYIEPTNRCNLDCRTCIRHSWDEELGHMDEATFSHIMKGIEAFDPPPTVFFGGFGEPLSHHRIIEMVNSAKGRRCRVELITNGTLLDERMSKGLIDAGLDTLWVSLDGATPESYADVRLGARLPDVLTNLKTFGLLRGLRGGGCSCNSDPLAERLPLKPEIGIVFVAMKRNLSDLPDIVVTGTKLGATRFMVTNVLPYTPDMCKESLYSRSLSDQAATPDSYYRMELPKINLDEETMSTLFVKTAGGHSTIFAGADHGESVNQCPFINRGSTAISWDGSLSPCLPLMHDHTSFLNQLQRTSRRRVIGNVNERTLTDLWNGKEYVAFRDQVQRFDFSPCSYCGGCDLSESNEEDCAGNDFPTCGGCLWAQGIIQCP
jgi:MoaA/NifB/PqqE/SkfB family radical SAM enzyme